MRFVLLGFFATALSVISQAQVFTEFTLPRANSEPVATVTTADGNTWIGVDDSTAIVRLSPTGVFTEFDLPSEYSPPALALGADGNVWLSARSPSQLVRITPAGAMTTLTPGELINSAITGQRGNVLSYYGATKFGQVLPTGTSSEAPLPSSNTSSLVYGGDGLLVFLARPNNAIALHRLNNDGSYTKFDLSPQPASLPTSLILGPDNNFWTIREGNGTARSSRLLRITPTGTLTETVLDHEAGYPRYLTRGPDNQMWFVTVQLNARGNISYLNRVTVTGEVTKYVLPGSDHNIRSLSVGANGDLWMTARNASKVIRFTIPQPGVQISSVFSGAQSTTQSFVRFHNTGTSASTLGVTLAKSNGDVIGTWTSPVIPAGTQVQYAVSNIEAALRISSPPSEYAVTLETTMTGYAQHVLYRPADGTLTNASTCGARTTSNRTQISGVHSGLLQNGFPSTVIVHNTSGTAASVSLGIYDASSGQKFGAYPVPSLAAGAQTVIPVSSIEGALGLTPGSATYHYIVKAEGTFTGFLQHLVNNQQVGVITDMTTSCGYNLPVDTASTRLVATEFPVGITSRSIAYGADGNMWTTQESTGKIGRVTPQGALTEFALSSATAAPSQIVRGSDGNMWFTERTARQIGRITPDGVIAEFSTDGIPFPEHIVAGPDGNLWFLPAIDTTTTGKFIGRMAPNGAVTKFRIGTGVPPVVYIALFVGPDGSLWVTRTTDLITRITTDGVITEFRMPTTGPRIVKGVVAPDGTLWFLTNATSGALLAKMTPSGTVTTFQFATEFQLTASNLIYGADDHIWILYSNGMVTRTSLDGVTSYHSTASTTNTGIGIASDGVGNVWFAGTGAKTIGRFNLNQLGVRGSAGFASTQSVGNSFLRLHNTGTAAGVAVVAVSDAESGELRGRWTSPTIVPNAQLQVDIGTIERSIGLAPQPAAYHAVGVSATFTGTYQHVLFSPRDGTLTNLSTCNANTSANTTALMGVHSALLTNGFPSSVVVLNNSRAPATARLGAYDARTGVKLGEFSSRLLAPNAQEIFAASNIEAMLGIVPDPALYHYVIKNENYFPGFLQHLVNNTSAGVITDMTTVCKLH